MEPDDCVFCNIAMHTIPSKIYHEDEDLLVVQDILPQAPVHVLVITKKHIDTLNAAKTGDEQLLGRMILAGKKAAEDRGVSKTGYRLAINVGKEGGQVVPHLHLHVLGGKQLPDQGV